jgi:hypothetical protein
VPQDPPQTRLTITIPRNSKRNSVIAPSASSKDGASPGAVEPSLVASFSGTSISGAVKRARAGISFLHFIGFVVIMNMSPCRV